MSDSVRIGREHEDRASDYLRELGYTILAKRFKVKGGEIDIVALDENVLVFVEVKYRKQLFQSAEAAITRKKMERLGRAAVAYFSLTENPPFLSRFDVIAIDPSGLRHYPAAFSSVQPYEATIWQDNEDELPGYPGKL